MQEVFDQPAFGPDGLPPRRSFSRDWLEGVPACLLGLNRFYRWFGPTGRHVVVLNYHHVNREDFRRHLEFLLRNHEIVGLAEAVACAGGAESSKRRRVALTFDDGYESFLEGPYPELQAAGVSATLFIATGLLGQVPFWYAVARAAALTLKRSAEWQGRTWDLTPGRTRDKTRAAMVGRLKGMYPVAARDAALAELLEALEVTVPEAERRCPRVMKADDLKTLDPAVVTIGAHTRHHPRLAALDAPALADEIAGGRAELEAIIGRPVQDFAYPYGRAEDVSAAAREAVAAAGLRSAFTTVKGDCRPGSDAFALPRVDLSGRERGPALAVRAGGVTRFLKSMFRRTSI